VRAILNRLLKNNASYEHKEKYNYSYLQYSLQIKKSFFHIHFIILHHTPLGRLYYPHLMVKEHEFQGDSDLPQKHMASLLYTMP